MLIIDFRTKQDVKNVMELDRMYGFIASVHSAEGDELKKADIENISWLIAYNEVVRVGEIYIIDELEHTISGIEQVREKLERDMKSISQALKDIADDRWDSE